MRYLLDSHAVVALLNDTTSAMAQRARREKPHEIAISSIVAHELFYGAFKSRRVQQNVALIDALRFPVLDLDTEDARQAGEVRAFLAAKGTPLGPHDALIAGQAIARKMILVTHNMAAFGRVPGLGIEDWEN